MRVLMLNFEYPPIGGGAATATKHLLQEFSRSDVFKDLSLDLVTASENQESIEHVGKNSTVYKLDIGKKKLQHWTARELFLWTWKARKKIKELLVANDYDLCHCWFTWPPGVLGWWFRRKTPYIVGLRGSDVPGFSTRTKMLDPFIFKPVCRTVWKHAQKVFANSQGLKELAYKTKKLDFGIIPNGVDTTKFKPGKQGVKEVKIRLLYVGRLLERKNIDQIIRAMKTLDVLFDIIGEGKQEKELKALVEELGLHDRVRFHGYISRDALPQHYRKADIFILPSSNEGMSNTLLEAIASGLAVIVTDTGGTKELVEGNGIILEQPTAKLIRQAVSRIDSHTLKKMKCRSREIALKNSWGEVARKYFELYKEESE